ncbi:hypothetical protein EON65_17240 [archaeon]|nr:MAG: hypothetical protein EON65_17240 [archaeon]
MLERSLQQVKEKAYLEGRLLHLETIMRNPPGFLPAIRASETKLGDLLEELQLGPKMGHDDHKPKSVVWHSPRKKDSKARTRIVTVGMEVSSEHPLAALPSKGASIEYAKRLEEDRQAQQLQALQEQQKLNDLQEEIIAKNRARKAATLRSMKEKLKEDIDQKNTFLQVYKAEMAKLAQEREMQARKEERAKLEAEIRERQRIEEIRLSKLDRERQEQEELKQQLELEASFIARIVDDQEAREIARRLKEEDRMRYLEERRRAIELKNEEQERKKEEEKQRAKERAMEVANRAQARVRQGNFMWHNGKFSYYDNVRKDLQEYVQYEDGYGRSYYYDPIYNSYQYRPPADSTVHSFADEQRKEYDAMYGEGAYDAYMADIAFKDSVNQNGGYYNDKKEWIVANGYYDENYNWIEYEGFYDDQGKFVRFAKVSGDLNFMV